jgi:hypothetical protein
LIWRYLLRRDDPSPAPWEKGAKQYPCIVPEMCKEESNEGQEDNPAKKLKLEIFKLDKETKALVDQDTVIGVTSFIMPFSFVLSYIELT